MTYQKFITDPMPEYSKGEEIFNYVSHIVGGAVGVGTVVAKKAFTKEEVKEDDDLSKQDKKDLSQYKDDYFEEG